MRPSIRFRILLVALAVACALFSGFAFFDRPEFEPGRTQVPSRIPNHQLRSFRSSPGRSSNSVAARGSGNDEMRMESSGKNDSRISRALLQSSTVSCPLDFRGMKEFPWFAQTCQHPNTTDNDATSSCCIALTYALGQAESEYLRTSGMFRLKDEATVGACIASLTAELQSEDNDLDANAIVPNCFPESEYSKYASHPYNCEGIETRADFEREVGPSNNATLNQACSGPLIDPQLCALCVQAIKVISFPPPNDTDCTIYTLFYTAGVSSLLGPYDQGTAECILAVGTPFPVKTTDSKNITLHIAIGVIAALGACLIAFTLFFLWWKRRRNAKHRAFIERHARLLKPAMTRPNTGLIEYSFEEIKAATNNFSPKNHIGSGGFGHVYHGKLDDGLEVAVKRMTNCSLEGDADFVNEVNVINSVRHRNLVILRGCCVTSTDTDGHQRLLVYDYMPNGSLNDYLFGNNPTPTKPVLPWPDRRSLAVGMAKGISYLHNEARPPIIHRDIKASNVLLDEDFNAKVADFGLAKFSFEGQTQVSTAVAGTLGYVAPEYTLYGQLTEKSDVYSFGVVLLELMSGRNAFGGDWGNYASVTDWAWAKEKAGRLLDTVDERIRDVGPRDVMERYVRVGILCSHMMVAFRPSMEEALKYLEGDLPLPHIPNRPMPINQEVPMVIASPSPSPRSRARLPASPSRMSPARTSPRNTSPRNASSRISSPRNASSRNSSPRNAIPPSNIVAEQDALQEEDESEGARLYKARVAMSEFSGTSAGVPTAELLR